MKAKKTNKIKMIVAVYLAVTLVISAVAIVGVSAKTVTKEHRVELMWADDTYDDYEVITLGGEGRISDTFASYPTILGGYSSSYNRAVAYNSSLSRYYPENYFTLYANGGMTMVTHVADRPAGNYVVYYYHESGGQCRAYSTLSATY